MYIICIIYINIFILPDIGAGVSTPFKALNKNDNTSMICMCASSNLNNTVTWFDSDLRFTVS